MDSTTPSNIATFLILRSSVRNLTDRRPNPFCKLVRVGDDSRAIQGPDLTIFHQDFSVHDRRPHVIASRHVDEVRYGLVDRRLPGRRVRNRRRLPGGQPVRQRRPRLGRLRE